MQPGQQLIKTDVIEHHLHLIILWLHPADLNFMFTGAGTEQIGQADRRPTLGGRHRKTLYLSQLLLHPLQISLLLFHLIGLLQKVCFPWSLPKAGH